MAVDLNNGRHVEASQKPDGFCKLKIGWRQVVLGTAFDHEQVKRGIRDTMLSVRVGDFCHASVCLYVYGHPYNEYELFVSCDNVEPFVGKTVAARA